MGRIRHLPVPPPGEGRIGARDGDHPVRKAHRTRARCVCRFQRRCALVVQSVEDPMGRDVMTARSWPADDTWEKKPGQAEGAPRAGIRGRALFRPGRYQGGISHPPEGSRQSCRHVPGFCNCQRHTGLWIGRDKDRLVQWLLSMGPCPRDYLGRRCRSNSMPIRDARPKCQHLPEASTPLVGPWPRSQMAAGCGPRWKGPHRCGQILQALA
jgi:hypothetical protein